MSQNPKSRTPPNYQTFALETLFLSQVKHHSIISTPKYHSTASLSLTRDLLHKDQSQRLELKERPDTGTYVKDLSSFVCKSVTEIEHVMSVGNGNRSVG